MSAILGIDISKAKFDIALVQAGRTKTGVFANDTQGFAKLARWLKKQEAGTVHACLEATGTYGEALAEFLHEAGHQVSVVNPAQIKAYGQSRLTRNKTDQADARLIADFCATQHPTAWTPPPPEWKELQALVRHLDSLKTMRQQERNRLAVVAKRHNPLIAVFCQRLAARGKPKMAVIGAAMRKLLHLVYGVLKSGQPFDPDHLLKVAALS